MQKRRNKDNITVNTLARLVRFEIKRRNPEYFNVAWIRRYVHTKPHNLMRKNGCSMANGDVEWEDLLELLPNHRHLWRYKPQPERTIGEAVDEILKILESEKPKTFGPRWMKDRNQPAFVRIKKYCDGNWSKLKTRLPEPWKNRLTYMGVKL